MLRERYAGLDLSLTGAGILTLDQDGDVLVKKKAGYNLKKGREKDKIIRLISIAKEVISVFDEGFIYYVGIENYAWGAKNRGMIVSLAELNGVIKSQLYLAKGIFPVMIPCSEARKKVLGKGRLSKEQIVRMILEQYGINFDDHNIADAFVIAECLRKRAVAKS